ncbi:helix-turn-helix transcriptional regulator [Acidaminobacter sp. JC074]|uniref:helix-turn-helix domain-containing protein n=1 Tax=Acidaminobacter sp. JC074 TaxID=2530199 RepID=UPI001F10A667|nr:helix-turn-helix transcriptional regulator [Acidaminobacter sp. JC074]MCH4890671.1 helix-turn-helix transcriptional regulator [Acidaminobacter sp. JC074]
MKQNDLKELLLQDEEVKTEFDALKVINEIRSELIKLRIEKGLSQKQLAELIVTKQSVISRLESGNSNPSIEFLSKIAHALGKNLHISFT